MSLRPDTTQPFDMPFLSPHLPSPNLSPPGAHLTAPMLQSNPPLTIEMIQSILGFKRCQADINANLTRLNESFQSPMSLKHSNSSLFVTSPEQNEIQGAKISQSAWDSNTTNLLSPEALLPASPRLNFASGPPGQGSSSPQLIGANDLLNIIAVLKTENQKLEKHIQELQTELRTGIRTNQEICRLAADRNRYRIAVRNHKQKIRSMMMAQSLRTRRQGSSSAPLVSRASNAHRTSDDILTTAIIQRTGPRFEPTNPTIQKANGIQKHLKSEDNTSEVEALMNPIPPREDADSHFSKPEVQNVYRFLNNNYACLYDPKKRAFPQIVHNVPCLKVLQRYERAKTGRILSKSAAEKRFKELVAVQESQTAQAFIEVMSRREKVKRRQLEEEGEDE